MNNSELAKYRLDDAGIELRTRVDTLVSERDISGLNNVSGFLIELISNQVTNDKVSYIDIDEYVSYAIEKINQGAKDSEIKSSPLRMNMYR